FQLPSGLTYELREADDLVLSETTTGSAWSAPKQRAIATTTLNCTSGVFMNIEYTNTAYNYAFVGDDFYYFAGEVDAPEDSFSVECTMGHGSDSVSGRFHVATVDGEQRYFMTLTNVVPDELQPDETLPEITYALYK